MDKNNTPKPGAKTKIITPHNDLFLRIMTRKDKAMAFFKICVPNKLLQATDLNQAELIESKHIRDRGHSFYNDLLYRCPLLKDGKQIGHVILTCEHVRREVALNKSAKAARLHSNLSYPYFGAKLATA